MPAIGEPLPLAVILWKNGTIGRRKGSQMNSRTTVLRTSIAALLCCGTIGLVVVPGGGPSPAHAIDRQTPVRSAQLGGPQIRVPGPPPRIELPPQAQPAPPSAQAAPQRTRIYKTADGKWRPASGFHWLNASGDDLDVRCDWD